MFMPVKDPPSFFGLLAGKHLHRFFSHVLASENDLLYRSISFSGISQIGIRPLQRSIHPAVLGWITRDKLSYRRVLSQWDTAPIREVVLPFGFSVLFRCRGVR